MSNLQPSQVYDLKKKQNKKQQQTQKSSWPNRFYLAKGLSLIKSGNFQFFVEANEQIDDWRGSHGNTNQECSQAIS